MPSTTDSAKASTPDDKLHFRGLSIVLNVNVSSFTCEEEDFASPLHLAIIDFHGLVVIDAIAESVREDQVILGEQNSLVGWREDGHRGTCLQRVKIQVLPEIYYLPFHS